MCARTAWLPRPRPAGAWEKGDAPSWTISALGAGAHGRFANRDIGPKFMNGLHVLFNRLRDTPIITSLSAPCPLINSLKESKTAGVCAGRVRTPRNSPRLVGWGSCAELGFLLLHPFPCSPHHRCTGRWTRRCRTRAPTLRRAG